MVSDPHARVCLCVRADMRLQAELSNNQALFPADSEIDMLRRVFCLLGTPTESLWSLPCPSRAVHFLAHTMTS